MSRPPFTLEGRARPRLWAFPALVLVGVLAGVATAESPAAAARDELRLVPAGPAARLSERLRSRADSCRVEWTEPFFYLWEWAQRRCEATRCELSEPREIAAVSVVLFNYGDAPAEKGIRVFLLADDGGVPGPALWSLETTTTTLAAGETREVAFAIDPPVGPIGPGPIWLGHEELAAGPPTSLFDGLADAIHASSLPPCGSWNEQDLGDYLQFLPSGAPGSAPDPAGALAATGVRWRTGPQPARGSIRAELELSRPQSITLRLVSPGGRLVARYLEGEALSAGLHRPELDASGIPSGLYWLRLESGGAADSRRVLLLR